MTEFMQEYSIIISLLLLLAVFYYFYILLIRKRNVALEALSGIDVQLKKRTNTIPNILKIAAKFLSHERQLMTDITELRAKSSENYDPKSKMEVNRHIAASEALGAKMGQLMVAVEDYPELKSDSTMMESIRTYNEIEEQIAAARRFYNAAVTDLNNSVQIFPISMIARIVRVEQMPFYRTTSDNKPVDAGKYFG